MLRRALNKLLTFQADVQNQGWFSDPAMTETKAQTTSAAAC